MWRLFEDHVHSVLLPSVSHLLVGDQKCSRQIWKELIHILPSLAGISTGKGLTQFLGWGKDHCIYMKLWMWSLSAFDIRMAVCLFNLKPLQINYSRIKKCSKRSYKVIKFHIKHNCRSSYFYFKIRKIQPQINNLLQNVIKYLTKTEPTCRKKVQPYCFLMRRGYVSAKSISHHATGLW